MNVKVEIQFASPTDEDMASMRSVARALTNDPKSVRVAARDGESGWLVAEFTMPTESQNSAVGKIDGVLRFQIWNRVDSTIMLPKSAEERQRTKRKAERRRAAGRKAREPWLISGELQVPDAERIAGRLV